MRKKLQLITSLLVCMAMVLSLSGNIRLFAEESDGNTLLSYDYVGTESDAGPDEGFIIEDEEPDNQEHVVDGGTVSSAVWTSTDRTWRDNWGTATGLAYSETFKGRAVQVARDYGFTGLTCSQYVAQVLRANGEMVNSSMTSATADTDLRAIGYKPVWSAPINLVNGSSYTSNAEAAIKAIQQGDILVWSDTGGTPHHMSIGYIYDGWIDSDLPVGVAGSSVTDTLSLREVCVLQSDGVGAGHMTVESLALYLSGAANSSSYGTMLQIYRKAPTRGTLKVSKLTSSGGNLEGVTLSLYKVSDNGSTYLNADKTALGRSIDISGATDTAAADNGCITKIATFTTDASGTGIPTLTTLISNAHSTARDPSGDWYSISVDGDTIKGLPLADYILVEDKAVTDSSVWVKGGTVSGISDVNGNAINTTLAPETVQCSYTTKSSLKTVVNGVKNDTVWAPADMGTGQGQQFYAAFELKNTFSGNVNAGGRDIEITVENDDTPESSGLKLLKTSAITGITANNNCYSLAGAVYAVYEGRDSAIAADVSNYISLSGYIGTLTTDASGNTNMINNLNAQNYYVKEVVAPKGYALDDSIYTIDMTDSTKVVNGLYTLSVQDTPQMDPITIALYKKNSNGVGIADAQYTVKFYEGEYPDGVDPATLGKAANRSWVLKTDSSGQIRLEDSYKISGSDWYRNPNTNAIQFPLGTVTIQETKAPDGYLLDNTVYVRRISSNGVTEHVDTYNAPTITENAEARLQVKKTSTEPTIIDLDSSYSLAGAVYAAFQDVSSANNANKDNYSTLRGYVGAMTTDANGLSDKLTGLNPGTYYVKEVMAPDNFKLDETVYTVDLSDPLIYSDNTYIVESAEQPDIHIGTKASDIETNDNISNADTEVIIKDICSYTGLEVGKEYTVKGELMLKSTGEPLLVEGKKITAEKTFTADVSVGTVELTFPAFDASELVGESVVVFEKMYREDVEVAAHSEITDEGQTINFPEIGTHATNEEGEKDFAFTDKDTITLVDTVSYKNVLLGKTYTISGVLMDKDTEKPVTNKNGMPIMASAEITPTEKNGTAEVIFTVENASEILGGKTVVVFEDMSYNGVSIAVHADIEDKDQTVDFPKLGTSMSETVSGLSVVVPRSRITLTDTVEYTNLVAGKTYILKGKLMDEETGEPFVDAQGNEILAEKEFTPTVTSGSVEVTFEFNAKLNKAYKVVAFEECWDKEEKRLVCFHCDIEDDNQTVGFPDVEIKTTAAADGKKEVKPSKETKLVDRVSYSDLPVGYTYEVSGVIMDKTTGSELLIDGKSITSGAIFTPATENGEIQVVYTLDTTNFTNRELVVYEEISVIAYADGTPIDKELVAEHKDINDKGQTIKITSQPKTGDDTPILPVVIVMLVCAGLGIFIICCKKKRH